MAKKQAKQSKTPALPRAVATFNAEVIPAVQALCNAVDGNRSSAQSFTSVMRGALLAMYAAAASATEFAAFVVLVFGDTTKGKKKGEAAIGSIRAALPEAHQTIGPVRTAIAQARRVANRMATDPKTVDALENGTLRGVHDEIAKADQAAKDAKAGKRETTAKLPGAATATTCAQFIAQFGVDVVLQEVAKVLMVDKTTKTDAAACAAIATKLATK